MQLATSTNLLLGRPDGSRVTLEQTLTKVSAAGFKVFDLNFYDWSLPGSPFLTEDWERWIDSVGQTAERLNVKFGQCHAYFYNFLDPRLTDEQRERHLELQNRSLECCSRMKAHTCVLHPETDYTSIDYYGRSVKSNYEYFAPLLDKFKSMGMKLALENMCDYGIAPRRKFCAYPEELINFVDMFEDESIGICWDFEHADIMKQNQVQALHLIGDRLFSTHVSDTYSKTDNTLMHVLPLTGTVDWTAVMKALKDINYKYDFTFEVHNFMNRLPDCTVDTGLLLAYQVGEYLLSLANRKEDG